MLFYKKLSLYPNPLIDDCIEELMQKKQSYNDEANRRNYVLYNHLYASDEITKYISPVLLDQFKSINLKPAIFINFSEYGSSHITWLHSDLTYHDNKWKPLEFGINWELAPGETTFNWYRPVVDNIHKSPSPAENELSMAWPRRMINGIHYYKEEEFENIGSVTFDINTAYIVKTDIPHKVVSYSPNDLRKCISVRFFYEDVPTWEKALETFSPFITD